MADRPRLLKWRPIATIARFDTVYRLERLSGRYSDLNEERTARRTVHGLAERAPVDFWLYLRRTTTTCPLATRSTAAPLSADGRRRGIRGDGLQHRPGDATPERRRPQGAGGVEIRGAKRPRKSLGKAFLSRRFMNFLFDLFPVALFFVAFLFWDIFVATAVAIAATSRRWRGSSCAGRGSSRCSGPACHHRGVRRPRRCSCRTRPSSCGSRPSFTGYSRVGSPGAAFTRRNLIRALLWSRCNSRAGLDAAQLELGGVLRLHGLRQPVRRVQLFREVWASTSSCSAAWG